MPLGFAYDTPFTAPMLAGRLAMTADNQVHGAAYLVSDPRQSVEENIAWDLRQVFTRDLGGQTQEYELRLGSVDIDPPFGAAGNAPLGNPTNNPGLGVYLGPEQTATYRLYVTDAGLGQSTMFEQTFTGNPMGPTGIAGDIDGNGKVDISDFGILKDNFGKRAAPVPEPSTLALLVLGVVIVSARLFQFGK